MPAEKSGIFAYTMMRLRMHIAPRADFGHPKAVLPQNVCPNVVCGANNQQRQNARIGVDRL